MSPAAATPAARTPKGTHTMSWQNDAREFGLHITQGGWRLGLLVARNVEPGAGEGRYGSNRDDRYGKAGKVSAGAFAAESGTSDHRILRYFAAWERAADAGHVPPAASLSPDTEPDLDIDALPDWGEFYRAPNERMDKQPERRDRIREQAKADKLKGSGKAVEVAANPGAMKAAIKADPPTAAAATEALLTDPASAEKTYRAARKAVINQNREERGLPPKTSAKRDERVIRIEELCDRVIRDLAEVLDPDTDPLGQRLAFVTDNLDALGDYHRTRLNRAVIKLTARISAWEDRARGLTGHTVAG